MLIRYVKIALGIMAMLFVVKTFMDWQPDSETWEWVGTLLGCIVLAIVGWEFLRSGLRPITTSEPPKSN